jgi:hypothetical protein
MKIPYSNYMLKSGNWYNIFNIPPDDSKENFCFGLQKRGVK